jgi:hypothetical protein
MTAPISQNPTTQSIALPNSRTINGVSVPIEYTDPVYLDIMVNPVIVYPSGNTFDQSTIDALMQQDTLLKDPLTRAYITSIVPNRSLKDTIHRFLELHPPLSEYLEKISVEEVPVDIDESITKLTALQFANLFADKDKHVFPADREIRIYGVNPKIAYQMIRYPDHITKAMIEIMDDCLLNIGKSMKQIGKGNLSVYPTMGVRCETSFLSFKSDTPWKIMTERGDVVTKISALLNRMYHSKVDILNIEPNQRLILKLSSKDFVYLRDAFQSGTQELLKRLHGLFLIRRPYNTNVLNINIGPGFKITNDDSKNLIVFQSESGIRIQLTRNI